MKIELNKYRNILAHNGYSSIFNTSDRTLTVLAHNVVESTYKCDYSCGTWYVNILHTDNN